MYARGIFIVSFLLLFSATSVFAEILTIDKEPPEFIKLREVYEVEKQQAASPEKLDQLKKKMAKERQDALRAMPYVQKRRALEAARDQEIAKIKANYQTKLSSLEKSTLSTLDKKQQLELAALKNKTLNKAHTKYIAQLDKLQKLLISRSDLAGALVVQTEKKKAMGTSPKAPAVSKPKPKPAPKPKPEPKVEKQKPPVAKKPAVVAMSKEKPRAYVSTQKGIAGSSGNMKNNIYTFRMDQVGKNSKLIFHAYGKNTNDSNGEVYLIMPNGKRKEVAEWSRKNLKLSSFSDRAKSAKDIKPVAEDISKYVKETGLYKLEFKYKGGDEALQIYQVEIQTW